MEDTLGVMLTLISMKMNNVLILVLMEDTLGDKIIQRLHELRSS